MTVEQFLTAMQQAGQGEPPPIFTYEGGPAEIVPNKTAEVMLNFQTGQYMLLLLRERAGWSAARREGNGPAD